MKKNPSLEIEKYSSIFKKVEFSEKDLQKFYGKKRILSRGKLPLQGGSERFQFTAYCFSR